MTNRTKIILCVCLIVVVLAVVGIFFIRKKEQKLPSAEETSVTTEEMLKLGDRGDNVSASAVFERPANLSHDLR